jgi:hypothetical protein
MATPETEPSEVEQNRELARRARRLADNLLDGPSARVCCVMPRNSSGKAMSWKSACGKKANRKWSFRVQRDPRPLRWHLSKALQT